MLITTCGPRHSVFESGARESRGLVRPAVCADQNGVWFFDAPNPSDLDAVFKQIAASLSSLRISMEPCAGKIE